MHFSNDSHTHIVQVHKKTGNTVVKKVLKQAGVVPPPNQQFFAVSKDKYGGCGRPMKNALYVLWYGKRHFFG